MGSDPQKLTSRLAPVLLGIHIVGLPLYPHMPLPVLVTITVFTAWTILIISGKLAQPGRILVFLLTATVVAVLMKSFGTILGQQSGSAMLLLLSFLKLFEMKSSRDIMIVIFMGFFLLASKFFYSQGLLVAVHVFVAVVYLTSLLIMFSDRLGTTSFNTRVYKSLRMIVQAVPLMLVLFVLFPRIPGPIWGLPKDVQSATTGLSDKMSPGSINRLVASGDVAFRVRFFTEPPPRSDLYWRGLVLSNYDGRTWRTDDAPSYARPWIVTPVDEDFRHTYTVMLEPHNQRWLYALESIIEYEGQLVVTREMQVLTRNKVLDVMSYSLRSDTNVQNRGLFEAERRKSLALPVGLNAETVRFGRRLYREANSDHKSYINRVLQHFAENEYFYTLNPPLLGENAMDDFLFGTRRGFCEHFASAFVVLMRAAGVPSRIVVGYQGGTMHPFDNYMIVRQSDAHAWAEVWLDDSGWVRVDPTAAVSPTRIENGIENAGLERELLPVILVSDNALFQRARYLWDSFHNNWNEWIVGYNRERQRELLAMLGLDDVSSADLVLWLVVSMTLAGSLLAWWVVRREPVKQKDEIKSLYDRYCRKLGKAGVHPRPSEAPAELLARASRLLPAKRQELAMITADYEHLRYGGDEDERRRRRYIRAVRRFRTAG
jgi:transglutaminase-like putative cysteine protease